MKVRKFCVAPLLTILLLTFESLTAVTYDDWRAQNFSGSDVTNEAVSGFLADPEESGLPNLIRYALGLELDDRPAGGPLRIVSANPNLIAEFTRPDDREDLTYQIAFTSALTNPNSWIPGNLTVTPASGGMERVRSTDTQGGDLRFARLQVTHSSGVTAVAATNLQASEVSSTEVDLTWDGSNLVNGFLLERSIRGEEFEIFGFVPAGVTSYRVRNLVPGEPVSFRTTAVGGSADTTPSNEETITPEIGPEGAILIQWRNRGDLGTNTITYDLELENSTTEAIPLTELTLRYWMDFDNEEPLTAEFFFSTIRNTDVGNIGESIVATVFEVPTPLEGATHYVDFTFPFPDLDLPARDGNRPGTLNMQGRLRKNYSGANQLNPDNDYSQLLSQDFIIHQRMNVLRDGNVIFGLVPGADGNENTPDSPESLRATSLTESSIELTWQDTADNESFFVIERDFLEEPGQFKILTAVGSNALTYQDTNLLDQADYRYRVRAVNNDGVSTVTNIASARTLEGTSPQFIPVAPGDLIVTAMSDRRLDLSWTDLSRNEGGFLIERQASGSSFVEVARLIPGTTSFIDFGLDPSTSYTYRLTAFNRAGEGATGASPTSTMSPQAPGPLTDAEITRFLRQATFGVRPDEAQIAAVRNLGFEAWIDAQFALPPTLHTPSGSPESSTQNQRIEQWWTAILSSPDQVRQRLAFALSQILVVSQNDPDLADQAYAMAQYYDLLVTAPESNFRELLEDVTFSPVMGRYLDHTRNQKANGLVRPDENYAREIMQLFSIGLIQLNRDGSPKLDSDGNPLPTYNQSDIEQVARVFTGLSFAGSNNFLTGPENYFEPMIMFDAFHETGFKNFALLNSDIPDINSGGDPLNDLELMHDGLAGHSSTAPFITRQLIQRTVTSNPSPGYIERVATVFENTNGDLGETFKAILLDYEARSNDPLDSASYGKQREPLLRIANLLRALDVEPGPDGYGLGDLTDLVQQAPLKAPSVFNFFEPDFSLPGDITRAGLVSPEFQTTQSATAIQSANLFNDIIYGSFGTTNPDFSRYSAAAGNTNDLLDLLSLELMDGRMSQQMRLILTPFLNNIADPEERAKAALYLVVTSAQFTIEQ